MTRHNRFGLILILALALLTLGAQTIYQAHARGLDRRGGDHAGKRQSATQPLQTSARTAPTVQGSSASVTLRATLDRRSVLRRGDGIVHIEVTLDTAPAAGAAVRSPTDVVVIVDRSGSMSGEKLRYAKEALRELIGRLTPADRFGLVTYESSARIRVPLTHATAAARLGWLRVVRELHTVGGTNMSSGLDLGQGMMGSSRHRRRAARVLLLSDGLANEGDSSLAGLVRRARRAVHGEYVLSTMGIGSDFDERVMTSLATAGTGAFYYLANLDVLPQFFDAELRTAQQTYAAGATLSFRAASGIQVVSVMGLPFERSGSEVVVPLGSLYSDHQRTVWMTLRVPSHDSRARDLGELSARFRRQGRTQQVTAGALPKVACVDDVATFRAQIDRGVWERAVLDQELNQVQERFGDAIRSGSTVELNAAVRDAERHRKLAKSLGSQSVLNRLGELQQEAKRARQAQTAPAPTRRRRAKEQKAMGYQQRNRDLYLHADPQAGY